MKKLLISFVVVLLLFSGIYLFTKNKSSYQVEDKEEKSSEEERITLLVNPALSENKTYREPTTYATFDVAYPQFEDASDEFNQKIEDLVMEGVVNHARDAEDNWKARFETKSPGEKISEFPEEKEKLQFYVSWTPVQVNKNFVSILLRLGGYTGGAHGYQNIASFNYDIIGEKEITLSDLFSSDPNYLKTVSEFARKDLHRQFKGGANEEMLLAGTESKIENFSVFTFLPDAITFYFAEYQVAPYAMGGSEVTMPKR